MPNFITPEIINIYETTIGKLRDDIGRTVTIISAPTSRQCPNCLYDPINKASANKYSPESPYPTGVEPIGPINFEANGQRRCPICNGKGLITVTANNDAVLCLISPLSPEEAEKTQLGKNFKINFELTAEIRYESLFRNAKKVNVDGTTCEVVSVQRVGIGNLSQVTVLAGG